MLIYASQPTNFGRTRFSNIPICEREVVLVAGWRKKKERVASWPSRGEKKFDLERWNTRLGFSRGINNREHDCFVNGWKRIVSARVIVYETDRTRNVESRRQMSRMNVTIRTVIGNPRYLSIFRIIVFRVFLWTICRVRYRSASPFFGTINHEKRKKMTRGTMTVIALRALILI